MNKITITLISIILGLSFATASQAQKKYQDVLELFIGQTHLINVSGVTRVAIGNGDVVDAKVLRSTGQVLIIANKTGITDFRIWRKNGDMQSYLLRVAKQSPAVVLSQVRAHLEGIEGVNARLVGDQIIMEGYTLREEDKNRIKQISTAFKNVVNYVSPGGLSLKTMILLDAKVVEVKKNGEKNIGIRWDQLIAGPQAAFAGDFSTNSFFRPEAPDGILINGPPTLDPTTGQVVNSNTFPLNIGSSNTYFGLTTIVNSTINLLLQRGTARLLAEPKLVCKSGAKAEFLVGGEVPLPVENNNGSVTVTFKKYGILLNISPVADRQGLIATSIEVEVSTIDPSVSVRGIPGFLTRRTLTEVNVQKGQTIVLSGLLTSSDSKNTNKVPGIGQVPILGELFKSRQFKNAQTDLMIFVTPSIIASESDINKEMIQNTQQLNDEMDKSLRFHILD